MKKLFSLVLMTVLGSLGGAFAEEVTIFSMAIKSDYSGTKDIDASASSTPDLSVDYADVAGGSANHVNSSAKDRRMIGYQGPTGAKKNWFSFIIDVSDGQYIEITLDKPIASGDVISYDALGNANATGDKLVGLKINSSASATNAISTGENHTTVETFSISYTVKSSDPIVGQEKIYIFRDGGINTYFDNFKITREIKEIPYTTRTWDFSKMTVPYADGSLWTASDSNVRNNPGVKYNDEELVYYADDDAKETDDKTVFEPTKGLLFTINNKNWAVELQSKLIYISREGVSITIPDCKKGQTVALTIKANAAGRGFNTKNLSVETMNTTTTSWETVTATVVEDGDVTLTTNNGINVNSISTYYQANVASIGWASLYYPFDVTIPSGVEAYYAKSASSSTISLKKIEDVIPANTGVIIKAAEGPVVFTIPEEKATAIEGNLFDGVTEATTCEAGSCYVLSGQSSTDDPVFGLFTGTSLGANKAYLPKSYVPVEAQGKNVTFTFDDNNATAVDVVKTTMAKVPQAIKVLRNGKLILETINGTFNAAGGRIK